MFPMYVRSVDKDEVRKSNEVGRGGRRKMCWRGRMVRYSVERLS